MEYHKNMMTNSLGLFSKKGLIEELLNRSKDIDILTLIEKPIDSKDFEKKLSNILSKISNLSWECIILGDVNVYFFIKQTFLLYGFKQLIKKHTHLTDRNVVLNRYNCYKQFPKHIKSCNYLIKF